MKKPTILRTLIFVLAMMLNFASYSQNLISFNSKFDKNLKENIFLKASNQFEKEISSNTNLDVNAEKPAVPIIPHPVKKYAEGDYAGTVSICPNDGAELPKLFLCGLNDSRLIETGITNASSIVWMRRTGGCTPNTNGNCPNIAENCTWAGVATGPNYSANTAGEFKVVITYPDTTVFTFYFNVYKNEVDPTGITKSDVVASSNGCVIPARIIAGGFSSLYEYSFTTNPAPNTWQDSNTFSTTTPDTYNVFIRLKNVPSSCVFNVKNIVVSRINFSTTLTAKQPGCAGEKGSIKVTANTLNNQYVYAIYRSNNTTTPLSYTIPQSIPEHEFTGLDAGSYIITTTIPRSITGANCDIVDSKPITIIAANTLNNTSYIETNLTSCATGIIRGNANGGTGSPYRYFVNYNSTGFVSVPNGRVIVDKGGTYILRVEDLNNCSVDRTFTIANVNKPVYTINTTTSGNCNPTGTITVNVTNNNGYNTIQYSKDNGTNWQNSNSFTNLQSGDYNITIRYRTGSSGNYCQDAFTTVTIGTTTPLTASAGVGALPGCQPYPERGIVRITNPQGGTPPYEYYFTNETINHNGWSTYNEGYLPAGGPYTVRIRDSKGCTFDMTGIIIDSKPTPPKIEYGPISYNCDGTATQTVIINNGAGDPRYNFQYYLDGNPNPNTANPNVFLNVPAGSHIISVDYNIKSVSTYSNLLTETFGSGENTTSPGINTFYYCFERQLANQPSTWCNGAYAINDGDYSVTSSINQTATSGWNWRYPIDHTSNGSDPKGRFLAVNIGDQIPVTTILYEKQINDVIPNQPIMFEFYAMNLMMPGAGKADANLRIALVDASGAEISWFATGNIPRSSSSTDWKKYPQTAITLDPGNNTTLRLIVRSNVQATEGNDVAIDDIKVFQVPRVCGAQFSEPFTITPPPPFVAHVDRVTPVSCFGAGDGKFDIYAENFDGEFFYTLNGGTTWIRSTVDRVTIGPLSPATYNVKVRNHMTSTACDFDIPTTITSPARFTLDATATVATCDTPSVVEAIVGGGAPPYSISLTRISDGKVFPFVLEADNKYRVRGDFAANDLTPGSYTVSGTAGVCTASKPTNLIITGSTPPTAEIGSASNLCFNGTTGASIVILVKDGLGPFSYRVRRNGGNYSDYSTPSASRTITHNVTQSGNYEFEVRDANGCTAIAVSQQIDPQLGAETAVKTSLSCKATGSDATIEVTIKGGTAPYSYIVRNSSNTQVASGNTTNPVFEYSTGTAGAYTFQITDANSCTFSVTRTVDALVRPTAEATPHNAACNGGTGSVDLRGLTGKAPFIFQFNGTGGFTNVTHYDNLPASVAGTDYTFIVRDDNDCERSYSFKLFAPTTINGTAAISPVYNCEHPATITVSNVSGGTPQYKYTLLKDGTAVVGPQDGNTFTGINIAGVYTVRITDANSCFITVNAGTINALNPPAAMTITTTTAATCPTNKGNVTITNVTNAAGTAITGALEYRIVLPTAGAFQSSNVFNNLDANVQYTFEVRDSNLCTYRKTHTIAPPASFTVGGSGGNVTCFGAADGSATFTVTGIASGTNYSYVVDSRPAVTGISTGSPFTISVTGLTAGNHSITVTNSITNCPVSASVTIGGPTAALALNAPVLTHETCNVKGTAVINAVNGWGTYTYTLTPTSPAGPVVVQVGNNTFTNLNAGTYSVTVTDNGGCTTPVAQNFTINDPVNPVASIDTVNSDLCASGTGATIRVSPNTAANYTYSIDSKATQNNGTFTGVTPGNHTIRVTDTSTGCYTDLTVPVIAQPISASPSIIKDLDCTTTTPTSANATIQVEISNGYPDYRYRVNTTGAPFSGGYTNVGAGLTSFNYSAAAAGTYYFEITDVNNCTVIVSQVVNPIVKPTFSTIETNVLCKGGATGSITITGNPVTGTYEYSIDNGGTFHTSNTFGGLLAGNYQVVIRDVKNCVSDPQTVTIGEPADGLDASATVTKALSCGPGNASQAATITVSANGGTPFAGANPYRYSYNGQAPVTSNTFSINTAGNVTVVVTDANNCSFTVVGGVTIDVLDPPAGLTITPSRPITCSALDTNLRLEFTGGVGPFTYEITSPAASVVSANDTNRNHTFNGLAPGHYFFKVTDVNNCTITGDYEVEPVTPITVGGSLVTAVTCNNSSTGAVKFTVGGNSTGFTYVVRNTANTVITGGVVTGNDINFTGLPGGTTYTITVTNPTTGCTATASVTLANPAAIAITSASGTKVFCNKPETTITVTASGGTGTLYYAVVGASQAAPSYPADYNTSGVFVRNTATLGENFTIYVQDANGCSITDNVSVTRNAVPRIDPILTAQCYSGTNFTVTITGSVYNGLANATFGLNGSYNTNAVKTITGPGTYTLGIKDDNGCEDTTTIVVNDQLTVSAVLQKDLTCPTVPVTPTSAQINLSASGGNGTYAYEYRIGTTGAFNPIVGNTYYPTAPGEYYFRVTSGGCSAVTTQKVDVTTPVPPAITGVTEIQSIKCNGDETAAINIAIDLTQGVAPFVFNVRRTAPTVFDYGTQTSGLAAGTYTITVTDAKGCTDTETITINEPLPISFTLGKVDITCNTPGGSSLGEVRVLNVLGGTAPFAYHITNNFGDVILGNPYAATGREDHFFTVIKYGIYTVNVVDANGCSLSHQITIASPPSDLTINVGISPSDCLTGGSAKVSVVAPVGSHNYRFGILETNTPPYTTTWLTSDPGFPDERTFTGLIPGVTYTFVVHDLTTDCYYVKAADAPIQAASPMKSDLTPHNVTCKGAGDGSVSFSLRDYDATTTSVDYAIFRAFSNVQVYPAAGTLNTAIPIAAPGTITIPSPGGLLPGTYYIQFTEHGTGSYNGCKSASDTFEIKESSVDLSVTASVLKNENCNELGIIIAEARDGAGTYSYLISTSATMPSLTDTGWQPSGTFQRAAGTYYIFAKDANGCIKPVAASINLVRDPDPVFNLDVVNLCAAEGAFAINVTITDAVPTMAPYSISVNNGSFINFTGLTYTVSGLNSGLQSIRIQNKNGCPVEHTVTINPTPAAVATIDKILDCSGAGNAQADASITVDIQKGVGPFTYTVQKDGASFGAPVTLALGVTSFSYPVSNANAGHYIFTITDPNSCSTVTDEIIIDPLIPIVPSYTPTEPKCFGGTGSILLAAAGGKGNYTYTLIRTAPTAGTLISQTVPLFENLIAGDYTYTITDGLNCQVTGTVTLNQPTEVFAVNPVITPLTCGPGNVAQSATVVLGATGGIGGYEFSFNNSAFSTQTTYTVADTNADQLNIPYSVRDANHCTKSGTIDIFKLDPPTDFDMTQAAIITCNVTSTTVTISNVRNSAGVIAVPPGVLSYQIVSPLSAAVNNGANPAFTNLGPGNYVFQVTDDATGCIKQLSYEIKDVIKINIVGQSTTPITCLGTPDGRASFLVSGFGTGVGTYNYILDTNPAVTAQTAAAINLTNLAAGPHRITVYDDETGCDMFVDFDIDAPAIALTIDKTVTPRGCTTFGAVTVTAQNGWGDYTYTVTQPNGAALTNKTGIFGGLTLIGVYNITVRDANGCQATDTFELFTPINPTASIDATSVYCNSAAGATLVINASSTSPFILPGDTYQYSINNGATWSSNNTFANLNAGTYNIKVKDKFGCESTAFAEIINAQLFASAEVRKELFCTGIVDGTIRVSAVGGYPAYGYTVTKDGVLDPTVIPFTNGTYSDYTVTGDGTYIFTVIDSRSCPATTDPVEMVLPTAVVYTTTPTSPSCSGTQGNVGDGRILFNLNTSNDNPPYTYTIQRTAPTAGALISQTNNPLFVGLIAGTYDVNVISSRGCSTPGTVTIDEPTPVVAAAIASPFTCSPANVITETIVTVTGTGGSGTGAVSDYTYSDNGTNWYTTNTFKVFDNGTTQNLTYWVKDAKGCISSDNINVVAFPVLVSAAADLDVAADCPNGGIETIKVDVVGGTGNFEYQVSIDNAGFGTTKTAFTGTTFNYPAPAGHSYQFLITDVNTTCTVLTNVHNVPLYNIMEVNATASAMASCQGFSDGKITINIANYTGTYDYRVLLAGNPVATGTGINAATSNPYVITGLAAGVDYEVEVTQLGYPQCVVLSNKVTITEPPVLDIAGMQVDVENQNCHNQKATITVNPATIVGGTPGYMYAFVPAGNTPDPLTDYGTSNVKTFTTTQVGPLLFDSYDVYVRDVNMCETFKTVNISLDPMPAITNVSVQSQCASAAGYRIDVAANGLVPLKYSINGQPFQDDAFFTVFTPGNYTVTVMDKNQCTVTATAPVTVLEPLTLEAEVTLSPTCKTPSGTITLTAGGGTVTPPNSYIYTINNWLSSQVTPTFAGLTPGVYNFGVEDIITHCRQTVSIEITDPTDVLGVVLTTRAVTCNNDSNGGVSVAIATTNDNPPYTYSISGATVSIVDQISPEFNNLPAGFYTVIVKSGRGCESTPQTVEVTQPDPIVVNTSFTEYGCTTGNTTNNAVITVNSVTGGSENFVRYEFRRGTELMYSGTSNTYTEVDHAGGNYTVTVYDSNECSGTNTTPIQIRPFASLISMSFDVTEITCNTGETIKTNVTVRGTLTAPLQYTLTGTDVNGNPITPVVNNNGTFSGLAIGDYLVTVFNPATNCSIAQNHKVQDPNTFSFTVTGTKEDVCFGDSDGSVDLTIVDNRPYPNDEAGSFTYTITGPVPSSGTSAGATLPLTGLSAGRYEVVANLVGTPYCEVRTTFDIGTPSTALTMNLSHTRITCAAGNNDGTIDVYAEGGWGGTYQYELVGPVSYIYSEDGHFENLTRGHYTVNVKDSKGCIITDYVDLENPDPIQFNASATSNVLTCYGDDSGVITVSPPTGGQGSNYSYSLTYTTPEGDVSQLGPQPNNVFTGLRAGTYTVTVTDGFSCEFTSPVTITLTNPVKVEAVLSINQNITCKTDATLTLTVTGGTGPYTYSEDGNTYSLPFNGTITFPVPVGNHKYFVQDSFGCISTISNDQNIEPVTPLSFEVDSRNAVVNCKGDDSAIISVVAKGGLGNYEYTLLDANHNEVRPAQQDGVFAELYAGTYYVHAKSIDCEDEVQITVTEALELLASSFTVVPVKCYGDNNGKIVMEAHGGTGAIKFAIEPNLDQFLENGTFEGLEAGIYTVIVQDILGCVNIHEIEVKQPEILIAYEVPGSMIPEICKGDKDGGFIVQIQGGIAPYFESLDKDNGPFNPVVGVTKEYTGLSGGRHTVFIKDSNGCIYLVEVNMPESVVLDPTHTISYDCVNNAQSNMVVITIDPSNNPADIDYSLDGGPIQPSNIFTNIPAGDHTIRVRHTNGCTADVDFNIIGYAPLQLTLSEEKGVWNIITASAVGGGGDYVYSIDGVNFSSETKFKIYKTGTYTITVRDKNGCTDTKDYYIKYVDVCLDNYFTPAGSINTTWGPGCTNIYNNLTFSIFDRYGRVIAKYHYGQKWDGKYNGEDLPSGDYWYVLKLNDENDGREFVGHFTLYR
ncbi:T9SS type B sorting domain-containing protein [Flavobacterium ginsengiterrae]|uniref:MAM domain-containing protein n=1 Tax=Flavobacterium ginsengiterrae TaxID=871695 RepID=A0ABP7GEP5_9FLAO